MTTFELYQILNEKFPTSLSCEWDNDGLMCCPDAIRPVRRVLITLDVTAPVVKKALEEGFDLIVSHHPLVFKGLKAVNPEHHIAAKVIELIRAGVSVFSFHTRLDTVSGGVNDVLASHLGLCDVTPFGGDAMGRIGNLPETMSPVAFAHKVKEALGAPVVLLADAGRPVGRVAVLGGGGGDCVEEARAAGADTYVTGELKYHSLVDAPEEGMNLIEAGHFHTEFPVCKTLETILRSIDPSLFCEIYDSYAVRAI
jgi:dinuclear metal center YbgI/SA1388 family protein